MDSPPDDQWRRDSDVMPMARDTGVQGPGPALREPRRSEPAPRGAGGVAAGMVGGVPAAPGRTSVRSVALQQGAENLAHAVAPSHKAFASRTSPSGARNNAKTRGAEKGRGSTVSLHLDRPASASSFGAARSALGDLTNIVVAAKAKAAKPQSIERPATAPLPPPLVMPTLAWSYVGPGAQEAVATLQLASTTAAEPAQIYVEDPQVVQAVAIYAPQIYDKMFEDEVQALLPRPDYMDLQADLNGKMRAILVDWLVEVHMKYRLRSETLFLTVNLVDRYLSCALVTRKRLQLIGVTAMFIASKFEEIDPPTVHNFVYITDNAYTKEEILQMECGMLVALGFQVIAPMSGHFLERLLRAHRCDDKHKCLARYILELALIDVRQLKHTPSVMASAALLLSNELVGQLPVWPPGLALVARYDQGQLRSCALELRTLLDAAPTCMLQAVRRKYMQPANHSIATHRVALRANTAAWVGGA